MNITYTHLDRVLFPEDGFTKQDLINYYEAIAPIMLLHVHNHPIVMQRFPEGIHNEWFYQKQVPDYFPTWFSKKRLPLKQGGSQYFGVIQHKEDLLYLANQGVITPHLWLSTIQKPNYPDRIIWDLDPSSTTSIEFMREIALYLRDLLKDQGLEPYVMTTGSRGFHVVTPIKQTRTFTTVRAFAKRVGQVVVTAYPKYCTTELSKEKRSKKLFIDYLRNGYGQTSVAPYAVRGYPGAPVATPIEWSELLKVDSQSYTIKNISKRLSAKGDAWSGIITHARALTIKKV